MSETHHLSIQVLSYDNPRFGYNAATGKYEDLMSAGIIDPAKVWYTVSFYSCMLRMMQSCGSCPERCVCYLQVVRCCLEHAASVAKTFLTSDAVVTEIPEPEPAAAANPMDNSGTVFILIFRITTTLKFQSYIGFWTYFCCNRLPILSFHEYSPEYKSSTTMAWSLKSWNCFVQKQNEFWKATYENREKCMISSDLIFWDR